LGQVIWITGLPGSGKSTVARSLHAFLTIEQISAVVLDGDDLREAFNHKFGYTKEERIEVSRIYINLAKMLASQGLVVIVSTVSLFNEVFTYLETKIPTAKIVFIDANSTLLDSRNQKQLRLLGAQSSPGVSLEVDYPNEPNFRLNGDENQEQLSSIYKLLLESIK
jgi:adenylylsulfate kinase-like enzyme